MWIDSHCHLNHEKIKDIGSPEQLIGNAKQAGVDGLLTICCEIEKEFDELLGIARQNENVWCTVGTHPHDGANPDEMAVTEERLIELATSDPNVIGIGETGLDFYYNNSPKAEQEESFRKHIRACITTDLPMIVHARDADDDTIRIMREEGEGTNLKGVMHCFSSSRELGEAALDFGFYISFSGILTFNKADELRDFAKDVPKERLLVETDAPFLAPVPFRGKTNEPALVVHTGRALAELRGMEEEEVAKITTENFFRLFDRASLS